MSHRIEYLDFLRGIAIILVVMGHFIQYNLSGYSANESFNFIYSFHMGFFFFISGCVASLSHKKNIWINFHNFLGKKTLQLLIPFFVWGGINTILFGSLDAIVWPERILEIIKDPTINAPWFIFSLFWIQVTYFVCCAVCEKAKNKNVLAIVLFSSVLIVTMLLFVKKQIIGSGFTWVWPGYLFMFLLGHFIQTLEIKLLIQKIITVLSLVLFIVSFPLFDFHSDNAMRMEAIKIISSMAFSLFAYYLAKNNYQMIMEKHSSFVNHLGTHTLEIYLTHYVIIRICCNHLIDTSMINSVPLFFMVLLLSILFCVLVISISGVLKTVPLLSILLYGKSYKNKN